MDRLYKFINSKHIEQSPKYFVDGDRYIANPPAEVQKQHGYDKTFEDAPYPETPDGFVRDWDYQLKGNSVVRVWSEPMPLEDEE